MDLSLNTMSMLLIGIIMGLFIKHFLPSYINKKGENLATKEDIEDITKKIESVKMSMELHKHEKINLFNQNQQVLLNFFDEVTSLLYESLSVNPGDFPYDNGQSLYEFQVSYYKSVSEVFKCYKRIQVFLPHKSKLTKLASNLTENIIKSRVIIRDHIPKIKIATIEEQRALQSGNR